MRSASLLFAVAWFAAAPACGPKHAPAPDDQGDPVPVVAADAGPPDAAPPDAAPPPAWVTTIVELHAAIVARAVIEVDAGRLAAAALRAVAEQRGAVDIEVVTIDPATLEERLVGFAADGADEASATHAALAMTQLLADPHAFTFAQPQVIPALTMAAGGAYVAPGLRVHRTADDAVVVNLVEAGGPAAVAGVKVGDEVVTLDGAPLRGGAALGRWLGAEPGTKVPMVVRRRGKEVALELVLAAFRTPPVAPRVERGIGIARIVALPHNPEEPAYDLIEGLRAALATFDKKKVTGIVFDLRGSLGGALPVAAVSMFTNAPVVWRQQAADPAATAEDVAREGEIWPTERPMAILIDEETVSAAELLVFALQDLDVAYVIGQPTAGGLTVPHVVPLPDGAIVGFPAWRVVGVAGGASPEDRRVAPTIFVANRTAAQLVSGKDPQLDAAIADVKQRAKSGKKPARRRAAKAP